MSSVQALEIVNVRAFGSRSQKIKFGRPLTLIVGHNGSGKTTIIESLAFVTTGSAPSGHSSKTSAVAAFLHDPKLRGEKETQALIKIELTTANGAVVTCSRRMAVTVKAGKLASKAMEGSYSIVRDGETITEAVLTTEMARQIPAWLGVSHAVLKHVIFCHQDDSFWPLDQPKKVKEQFDLLFEAQQWASVIDKTLVLKKIKDKELSDLRIRVEQERFNKDRGQEILTKCESLHKQIEALTEEAATLQEQLDETDANRVAASEGMQAAGHLVGKLQGKRFQADAKRQSVQTLQGRLQELHDSDTQLEDRLAHYDERLKADETTLKQQEQHRIALQHKLSSTRDSIADKQGEYQSLQAQHDTHLRKVEARKAFIGQTANVHGVRGFDLDLDLDSERVQEFQHRMTIMSRDANTALDRLRAEARKALQSEQKSLNDINERKTGIVAKKDNARQQIISGDRKLQTLQTEVDEIAVDEGDQAALQRQLESTTVQLKSLEQSYRDADWMARINAVETELKQVELQKQKFDDEFELASRAAGDASLLDSAQQDIQDRRQRIQTISSSQKDNLDAVLGKNWEIGSVDNAFKTTKAQAASALLEAQKKRDGHSRELAQVQGQLSRCQADLTTANTDITTAEAAVHAVTVNGISEYSKELQELETSRDIIKADADSAALMLQWFDSCLQDAEQRKVCRTCTRHLPKDADIQRLRQNLERQKQQFLSSDPGADLQSVEQQLAGMKSVADQYNSWTHLSTVQIPSLHAQQTPLLAQKQTLLDKLEKADEDVDICSTAQREVEAIAKTISSLDRYSVEIAELEVKVKDLTTRLQSNGTSRGLDMIKADKSQSSEQEHSLRSKLSQVRLEKEKADAQMSTLKLSIKDIEKNHSDKSYQLKHKVALTNQISELKTANTEQRQIIASCDESIKALGQELGIAQHRYKDLEERAEERDRSMQADVKKLSDSLQHLRQFTADIQKYQADDSEEKMLRTQNEVQELKSKASQLDTESGEVSRQTSELQNTLRNQEHVRRNIDDNIQYRKDSRALQSIVQEIRDLEALDAETEYHRHETESRKWQLQNEDLIEQRGGVLSTKGTLESVLRDQQDNFEKSYKGAAKQYREAKIAIAITEALSKDLGTYGAALDKALMKYHSIKMEEINRLIDELWRKTYQGTDVDTIYIRADAESKGGKAYDYRVCMLKQQTEMDMRGRCSAGQRVLACIIIRLALAECFSIGCGMIALDEPTTNLDHDNIQALASSLAELINARRAQKNFQLIVITHDEDFIASMQPSNYVDVYYRVDRDINQESYIKRESIHTLLR